MMDDVKMFVRMDNDDEFCFLPSFSLSEAMMNER